MIKKWLNVLIGERKLPKIEMCHLGWDKPKRKLCHLSWEGGGINFLELCTHMLTCKIIVRMLQHTLLTGLEEVMEFLEQSYPNIEIAIAHGKVIFLTF